MLMLTALPLENYAAKAQGMSVGMGALCVLMGGLLIAAHLVHDDVTTWLIVVGIMVAVSTSYLAMRWSGMVRGPVAFPSGRMA